MEEERSIQADDEMEVSDEEEPIKKKSRFEVNLEEIDGLREENGNLKCQLEAYKNEVPIIFISDHSKFLNSLCLQVEVIKSDFKKELEEKEKQFKLLQQTLQGMQQQLLEAKRKQIEEENKVKELQNKIKNQTEIVNLDESDEITECSNISEPASDVTQTNTNLTVTQQQNLNEQDAKLIGIISAFLNVHPFGAGLDYIWSYVSKLESDLRPSDLELLMTRFPSVFKQELIGIGANIERRWLFNAFKITNT